MIAVPCCPARPAVSPWHMRGTAKPFVKKYAGAQRQAIFKARFEHHLSYTEIARRAVSGELTPGEPWQINWQYIGKLCREEEHRRAGRFTSNLAKMPHRDAIEELRRGCIGVAEDLMTDLRAISSRKPRDLDPKRLQEAIKAVALAAGVAAFFGSLLTIGVVDILNPDQWVQYVGALVVAAITAGGVYSKERLQDAKRERGTVSGPR
jgi:hypothetical protein